ncbi:MAG: CHAD domain-containing protein [Candidatus Krumholzibacteriia bacterium]
MSERILIVAPPLDFRALLEALVPDYRVAEDGDREILETYLDTFDWALYGAGLALVLTRRRLTLLPLESGAPLAAVGLRTQTPPRFVRDVPAGRLRDALAPRAGVRALLRLVTLHRRGAVWRVSNRAGEIVSRLRLEHLALAAVPGSAGDVPRTAERGHAGSGRRTIERGNAGNARRTADRGNAGTRGGAIATPGPDLGERPAPFVDIAVVEPRRGYDQDAAAIRDALASAGAAEPGRPLLALALAAAGRRPCAYRSKPRVKISAERPAREAVARIARRLLRTMRENEAGVRQDVDVEFLHDFRVAVRRTRSLLSSVQGVYPPESIEPFTRDFRELGRLTGPLRDLDVFLLRDEEYERLLPGSLRPGLGPLFARLVRSRQAARDELMVAFDGPAYRGLLSRWQRFLSRAGQLELGESPRSGLTAAELAGWAIGKHHRRLVAKGRAITPRSPDDDLHALRIEGKKLRYLLEFFGSLYPGGAHGKLVKHLKALQDELGELNDVAVQTANLEAILGDVGEPPPPLTAAAVGALLAELATRRKVVRGAVVTAFARFDSPRTRQLFHALDLKTPPDDQKT